MHFFKSLAATVVAFTAYICPTAAQEDDRSNYTVPGLGACKQAILGASGNTLNLTIAMLEMENMQTDYTYGDNKGMLRVCGKRAGFVSQSTTEWNNGAVLNADINADVASRWDCQEYYGLDVWFAGHRNGASGISNPNTPDIARYRSAIEWMQGQIDSSPTYSSDDTRFWVDVTPI